VPQLPVPAELIAAAFAVVLKVRRSNTNAQQQAISFWLLAIGKKENLLANGQERIANSGCCK